jgi:hypothetical protein
MYLGLSLQPYKTSEVFVTLESAHIEIMVTLTNQRIALAEKIDRRLLDPIVADALDHELSHLIELREMLANHYRD